MKRGEFWRLLFSKDVKFIERMGSAPFCCVVLKRNEIFIRINGELNLLTRVNAQIIGWEDRAHRLSIKYSIWLNQWRSNVGLSPVCRLMNYQSEDSDDNPNA